MSMFPIRCFTCGKVLHEWDIYEEKLEYFKCSDRTLDNMGMTRLCCRRMYKSYVPQIEKDMLMYGEFSNIEGGNPAE